MEIIYGIEMAEDHILFLKILYGFSILTSHPPSSYLENCRIACVRKKDYLDSFFETGYHVIQPTIVNENVANISCLNII